MLKWMARNKYKLMLMIIVLYLAADVWFHKGQVRVLLPKTFLASAIDTGLPKSKSQLVNGNKEWAQAINTVELMNALPAKTSGIECDIYFNLQKNNFEVHHDPDKPTGLSLETLMQAYHDKKLRASFWLDFKDLNKENQQQALTELSRLRGKFGLMNKLLVESSQAELLGPFTDSGFFTSYYTPPFNPYLIGRDEIKYWTDSLSAVIRQSRVNALSGYYYQYSFLHECFPNYPIITWASNHRFSLVNWLFKRKLAGAPEVFVALYPQ